MQKIGSISHCHATFYKINAIFFTLSLTLSIYADVPADTPTDKSAQSRAISGHSIELNGIGLAYSYEHAFAPRGTVIFSAGSSYAYGQTLGLEMNSTNGIYFTTKNYHLITGNVSVEPRFYYNLQKRHRKDKRTFGNSGGYLAINMGYSFPIAITSGLEAAQIYTVIPYWGFRRVWKHFLLDVAGGIGYIGSSNGYSGIHPTFRIGLGYRF